MALTPGARLGRYEIVGPLGSGGMGEVYRARDTQLKRDVAVKVLPEPVAAHPDWQRRFEREARAVAALNHPHICQIHDVGPGYLVLEYVDGAPLRGPLTPDEARRLALQVASALETAHRQGILHRDLKPANILVTSDGAAKLLDFGLAKALLPDDDLTRTQTQEVVGTPAYMSPEQAQGKPLDPRSDVFSFGAVLYEVLSGARAFRGHSSADVMSAVLRDTPPPLSASRLSHVVRRCLEKDPARRYQTVAELRAAIEDAAGGHAEREQRVAVLPFADLSPGRDQEWFSDGLAEEIINALTRIAGVSVIARTSAFAFKGKHEDVRRIGEALDVTHVLEGSVRQAGQRIRVTVQLVAVADGSHVWSERYDRDLADVFVVQDEIAGAIAGALQVTLSSGSPTARRQTPALAAYDHYLKGLYGSQQWTPEAMARAEEHFERAIELDPQFALARAELAHLHYRFVIYGLTPARQMLPQVRQEASLALAIDGSLAEAHAMLGAVAAVLDYDWAAAETHFGRALAAKSVPSHIHRYYAQYLLLPMGRAREGVEHDAIDVRADPINPTARAEFGICLLAAGRQADGHAELRRAIELDKTFWFPYFILSHTGDLDERFDERLAMAERTHQLAPWFLPGVGVLAALLRRAGDHARADALTRTLESDETYRDPIGPALYHYLRGDLEASADWTETAIEWRQPAVCLFLNITATALRTSPRWPKLARLLNLPAARA